MQHKVASYSISRDCGWPFSLLTRFLFELKNISPGLFYMFSRCFRNGRFCAMIYIVVDLLMHAVNQQPTAECWSTLMSKVRLAIGSKPDYVFKPGFYILYLHMHTYNKINNIEQLLCIEWECINGSSSYTDPDALYSVCKVMVSKIGPIRTMRWAKGDENKIMFIRCGGVQGICWGK